MASKLASPDGKRKILAPVRPNLGIEAAYQRKLDAAIREMHDSLVYWIKAQYRANPPELALDSSSAADLEAELKTLGARWRSRFDEMAETVGRWFGKATFAQADRSMSAIMARAGWTVKFKITRAAQDVMTATIGQQVGLIKSIASEHLTEVQGVVMRSVQTGRDLGTLTKELEARYGVTRRRAALIARTQNNMATTSMTRVRQQDLGIVTCVWVHSAGGREPRESHVAFAAGRNGGPVYEVAKGALIDGERIWPGQLINCRCTARAIIEGLN